MIINLFIVLFSLFLISKTILSEIKLYTSKYASENVSKENLQTGRSKL